ncbi:amino acid permease 6 [Amborella trichopoda]|uniref:Amino acid transporter transmembrane domain-containing protein n=1 Tax=Amborella trichopoda TaxID=13333 RepID=U5DHP5_AMBTC|nr:amino acid permease 6 [Amborella trichopoda]XP_020531778.1 amino acid permease 6 [Amborella trichopoda]ERN20018.1 hypothetical protein AMTR_s00071p00165670 [Amborella trichopoda]|eukprot:XP_006858551.1 amino acid permease 6 [Amborella trichopoda]
MKEDEGRKMEEGGNMDDGRVRNGTVWTATAHIITAVIGSGVLGLGWSVSQLGWILGPFCLLGFGYVTYYTATLQADCYRYPNPLTGKRNYTYRDAVRVFLGPRNVFMCGMVQYAILWGSMVSYTIVAASSMVAMKKSNCFHKSGHNSKCGTSGIMYMFIYGLFQVILSQLPNLEKVSTISVVATITSFVYSGIGLALCIAKFVCQGEIKGSLRGNSIGDTASSSISSNMWNAFQALGSIAFAYAFAHVLIEIQDTLRPHQPENKTMKRAAVYGMASTAIFYVSLGSAAYAAFGSHTPGNILTGFGFYEPFWLVDIGNLCIAIHLTGAYQVYGQPIFAAIEDMIYSTWPTNCFVHLQLTVKLPFSNLGGVSLSPLSLLVRTTVVVVTTLVAMLVPFFNSVAGLIGAIAFWPLTVYFPVNMYIAQARLKRGTMKWVLLQCLLAASFVVSLLAAIGSVADIIKSLKHSKPFKAVY